MIGLIVVNLLHAGDGLIMFTPTMGIGMFLSALLSAGLSAGVGLLVSLRASSVRQAQQTLGLAIMLLLFVPIFGIQALPSNLQEKILWWILQLNSPQVIFFVLAILFILNLALIAAALVRFQRQKLILD